MTTTSLEARAGSLKAVLAGLFAGLEETARRLARRPLLSCFAPAALAIGIAVAESAVTGIPVPAVHDEFAYLLAADTFAKGRATNPPHAMARPLAEFHVLDRPTRQAKYPPGQGLALALGETLLGHPIAGVWLGIGFACGAMAWMLRALVPPRWALFGGCLAAMHPLIQLWGASYWGGGLAMAGGALALGAFLRLRRRDRIADALVLAAGFVVLSLTRPFEGAVLAAVLVLLLLRRGGVAPLGRSLLRLFLPVAAVLALDLVAIAWYDRQVTGSAWVMPYMAYARQSDWVPLFLWASPLPVPAYDLEIFRQLTAWEYQQYAVASGFPGLIVIALTKTLALLVEVVGVQFLCLLSLFGLPRVLRRGRAGRTLLLLLAVGLVTLCSETFFQFHYAAPFLPAILALAVLSLQHVAVAERDGRRFGRQLIRIGIVASLLLLPWMAPAPPAWAVARARIEAKLETLPGDHLVIVRYDAAHDIHADWVHNPADIDAARVVWARDMGEENRKLIDYYRTRSVWLLEPDAKEPKPIAYPQR